MNLRYYYSTILQTAIMSFSLLLILGVLSPCVSSSPVDTNNRNTQQQQQPQYTCHQLDTINTACSRWYRDAQLPNIFGHDTPLKAQNELNSVVGKIAAVPSDEVLSFMCIIYLPPCSTDMPSQSRSQYYVPLPCREMCDAASVRRSKDTEVNRNDTGNGHRKFRSWPVMCHTLPTQRCYVFQRNSGISYVKKTNSAKMKTLKTPSDEIAKVASIETEIGDASNNEGYDIEVVSLSTNQDHRRRYDITDLGDPDLFQGWADIQGTGSANDYCRVVGRSKRKFMSCHLSGNANQGHHYVSKLGFEIGYPGTWFMRDMDGDGKDDYCRCVGSPTNSKVTCMKAGERGFHGSPMQAGSQHSFALTSSTGCHKRHVNAMFGE